MAPFQLFFTCALMANPFSERQEQSSCRNLPNDTKCVKDTAVWGRRRCILLVQKKEKISRVKRSRKRGEMRLMLTNVTRYSSLTFASAAASNGRNRSSQGRERKRENENPRSMK